MTPTSGLVTNGDDCGLSSDVNAGIITTHEMNLCDPAAWWSAKQRRLKP